MATLTATTNDNNKNDLTESVAFNIITPKTKLPFHILFVVMSIFIVFHLFSSLRKQWNVHSHIFIYIRNDFGEPEQVFK